MARKNSDAYDDSYDRDDLAFGGYGESNDHDDESEHGSSKLKIGWTVYSIILLGIIAGLLYYIYLVANGSVYSYGHDPAATPSETVETRVVQEGNKSPEYADTPEVKELTKLPIIDPKELKADGNVAVFRNPEASMVCAATKDFQKHPANEWIPKWISVEGNEATGPGVECSISRAIAFDIPQPNACPDGVMAGHAFGLSTNEGPLKGMCWAEPAKLFEDIRQKGEERYSVPELPFGYRVEIGNYSCAYTGLEVTCADVTTGKGMKIDDQSVTYFGADE